MLSLLGDNPEFFVARGNTTSQIIVYSLVLAFVAPLIALGLEAIARLINRNLQWGLHLGLMTLFAACFVLQLIKGVGMPAGVLIAVSLLLAGLFVFAYASWSFPRSFMDILSIAPVVILIVFFGFSSTSRLVLPKEQPDPVDVTVGNPVPVVMVIFDEFPTGSLMGENNQVDGTRFPAFADLASSSTWYRNATAAGAYTPIAAPSILSGETPDNSKLPIAADHPRSLFTLLGKTYELRVQEAATQICPEELCPDSAVLADDTKLGDLFSDLEVVSKHLLLPDSLRSNLPDVSKTFSEFTNETDSAVDENPLSETDVTGTTGTTGPTGESVVQAPERTGQGSARKLGRLFALRSSVDEFERINSFSANFSAGQEATLDFIHVEKPHYPWRHIPDGQRYTNLTGEWNGLLPNDGPWMAPPKVVDIPLQRHLLEVGYTDTLLGRVTARLKKLGLWDEAMVIVTADHGAAFQSQVPRRAADPRNLGEIASVPLFIKAPGQTKSEISDKRECATDILPAIADELEIDYPWPIENCPADEVRVINAPSGEAVGSVDAMVRQRQRLVNRIQRLFKTGQGWGPTYRFGPRNDLIGKKVSALDTDRELTGTRVLPDRSNAVKNYDPASPSVLGLLQRGYLKQLTEDKVLAIAVDGKIEATGYTFKDGLGFGPGFSILLPPESLKKGFNRVDIYLVQNDGKKLQLVYDGNSKLPATPEGGAGGS